MVKRITVIPAALAASAAATVLEVLQGYTHCTYNGVNGMKERSGRYSRRKARTDEICDCPSVTIIANRGIAFFFGAAFVFRCVVAICNATHVAVAPPRKGILRTLGRKAAFVLEAESGITTPAVSENVMTPMRLCNEYMIVNLKARACRGRTA
jgi:hypothetical protein